MPRYAVIEARTTRTAFVLEDGYSIITEDGKPLMRKDKDLFFEFMDSLFHDEETFNAFAELMRDFVLDDREYLDKALLFRDFARSCLIHFSEEKANHVLTNR